MFEKNRYSAVSLNYFLFFALSGTFIPFIFIYLQSEGWSGVSIGIYSAIGPLVAFLVQPIWGYIADRRGRLPLMFAVLILLSGAIISIYKNVPVGPAFYVLAILLGIFQNPLNPMIDSMSIRALGEQKNSWGLTRLWGSLGFAVSSFIMGKVFTDSPALIFTSYGVGTIFVALAIFVMPFEEKKAKEEPIHNQFAIKGISSVLTKQFFLFLAAISILQLGQSMPLNFLSVVMTDRGASSALVGLAWSITAIVELPVYFRSEGFITRFSPERVLIGIGLFKAVRFALFAISYHPIAMLIVHATVGIGYALLTAALIILVDQIIPTEYHATGFTLYVAFTTTLPHLVGGLLGGKIYDLWGGTALYFASALTTFLGVFAFYSWYHSVRKPKNAAV